jgi:hypothetical protein
MSFQTKRVSMNFTKTRDISAEVFKMIRQIYENQTVSNLEKDLLKEKLRRLYEAIDEINQIESSDNGRQETQIVEERELPPANFEVFSNEPPALEKNEEVEEFDFTSMHIPTVPIKNNEKSEPAEAAKQLEIIEIEPTVEIKIEPTVEVSEQPVNNDEDINDLFVFTEAKELLEKLRDAPITDISKAFTLNERLLYAKVLFGNNLEQMNHILGKLNHLDSYDEAKRLIVEEVIYTYGWNAKDKKKTAKELIQVVKRRYSKV